MPGLNIENGWDDIDFHGVHRFKETTNVGIHVGVQLHLTHVEECNTPLRTKTLPKVQVYSLEEEHIGWTKELEAFDGWSCIWRLYVFVSYLGKYLWLRKCTSGCKAIWARPRMMLSGPKFVSPLGSCSDFNLLRFGGMISWIYPSESGFNLPRKPVKSSSRCTQPQLTALQATLGNFGTSRRGATWGGNDVEPWPCRWAPTPGGTSNCFVYGQGSVARCISENRWQQWQLVKKCHDFGRILWIKQLFYRTWLGASTHRDWLLEVIHTFFGRNFWWAMIQLLARQALEIAEDFLPPGWISSISISVDAKWTKRSNAVCLHNAKVEAWYKNLYSSVPSWRLPAGDPAVSVW